MVSIRGSVLLGGDSVSQGIHEADLAIMSAGRNQPGRVHARLR